ncbi:MAG TPA: hypothetical protein H9909_00805 [Candidatus Mediterraneibacter norfolkensis]|nr:hypothetical protein [Candidatus Mediterraneibacter norfolkensis]
MPDISALATTSLYAGNTTQNTRSTGSTSTTNSSLSEKAVNSLSMTDFYELLATQLQYQDADNPMDTSEMMDQLVQTQMSQMLDQMTSAISDLTTVNLMSYSSSMMGKEVTLAEVDSSGNYTGEETTGVVTGVTLGTTPSVIVNGKEYSIVQIMSVGQVPQDTEVPDTETPETGDGTQTESI